MTFNLLHDSIAQRDIATIDQITEGNLREAFHEFFDTLDEEHCKVEGVNVGSSTNLTIELIDYCQIFGADINRSQNRIQGVKAFSFGPMKPGTLPHLNCYFP